MTTSSTSSARWKPRSARSDARGQTGSGKLHFYVAWEPGLPALLTWQGQRVGEIKRGGSLAAPVLEQGVLPPSLRPDGPPYTWLVDPRTEPLIVLPEAWRRHLRARIPVSPPAFTAPEEIREGERNTTLYRLMRSLRAQGLSLDAVSAAADAENLQRARPPLPPDEMAQLLAHAWTQPDRPDFGAARNGAAPQAPPDDASPETAEPSVRGLGAFLAWARRLPPLELYVDGLLPSDGSGWVLTHAFRGQARTSRRAKSVLCLPSLPIPL
jgi:Primase C terminal 1 (PriCT-1)